MWWRERHSHAQMPGWPLRWTQSQEGPGPQRRSVSRAKRSPYRRWLPVFYLSWGPSTCGQVSLKDTFDPSSLRPSAWPCPAKPGDPGSPVGTSTGRHCPVPCPFPTDKPGTHGRYKGLWSCFSLSLLSSERKLSKDSEDKSASIVMEQTQRRYITSFGRGGCCVWRVSRNLRVLRLFGHPRNSALDPLSCAAVGLGPGAGRRLARSTVSEVSGSTSSTLEPGEPVL